MGRQEGVHGLQIFHSVLEIPRLVEQMTSIEIFLTFESNLLLGKVYSLLLPLTPQELTHNRYEQFDLCSLWQPNINTRVYKE